MSRWTCGEGMPAFYAKQIMEHDVHCISKEWDYLLLPFLEMAGLCKSISSYGHRIDEDTGLPMLEDCQKTFFAEYQLTREAISFYRALYYNELQMRDKFADYWVAMAERFHENEFVIGFDPINEPFPAWHDMWSFLTSFIIGGRFDQDLLSPMYHDIYTKMKEKHVELPMFFEPTQVGDWMNLRWNEQ